MLTGNCCEKKLKKICEFPTNIKLDRHQSGKSDPDRHQEDPNTSENDGKMNLENLII